jgi:hypothetical protein
MVFPVNRAAASKRGSSRNFPGVGRRVLNTNTPQPRNIFVP